MTLKHQDCGSKYKNHEYMIVSYHNYISTQDKPMTVATFHETFFEYPYRYHHLLKQS